MANTQNAYEAFAKLHARLLRNFDAKMQTEQVTPAALVGFCELVKRCEEEMEECDKGVFVGNVLPREFFNEMSQAGRANLLAAGWTLTD